jgi:hypothetical protein
MKPQIIFRTLVLTDFPGQALCYRKTAFPAKLDKDKPDESGVAPEAAG